MHKIQVKLDKKIVQCRTTISPSFFVDYQKEQTSILKISDFEKRFKRTAFFLIVQETEELVTYQEFDSIKTGRLKNIAELLLKNDIQVKGHFMKTNKRHSFFHRICEAIETYNISVEASLKEIIKPVIESSLQVSAIVDVPLLTQPFEKINAIVQVTNNLIPQSIRTFQAKINRISESMKIINQNMIKTISFFQNLIPPELMRSLDEFLLEIDEFEEVIMVHTANNGWFNYEEVKYELMEYLLERDLTLNDLADDPNLLITETNTFMEGYYTNDSMEELLNRWKKNDILNRRIHIIKSAFEAHKDKKYDLSIPVFFAQLEGIVRENLHDKKKENMSYKNMRDYISDIRNGKKDVKSLIDYFKSNLHEGFQEGKELNSDLSRHAILHGYDVSYGSKVNSLKLIIIFDIIQSEISSKKAISDAIV
ncbi:hypothetical protein RIF24_16915 (plasmid) [Exiguobacterium acetylicum]|uniref:hypothetical protein n=1 Tax=Exiguobacterium acetylicum TaxID=41170 RepID=UPI003977CC6A